MKTAVAGDRVEVRIVRDVGRTIRLYDMRWRCIVEVEADYITLLGKVPDEWTPDRRGPAMIRAGRK